MPVTQYELEDLEAELCWLRHLLEVKDKEMKKADRERTIDIGFETRETFHVTISVNRRRA